MTYEEIKKDALEHLERATHMVNGKKSITSYYCKTYSDEEVEVIKEHLKTLKGEDLINEVMIILDCGNPNENNSGSFKELMMEYKEELLIILKRPV